MADGATVGNLLVRITGDATQFQAALRSATTSMETMGAKMQSVGRSMSLMFGATITAFVTASSKMAADFGGTINKMVGLVGISREQAGAWRQDILKMSVDTGKSAKELGDAMFFVTSAGLTGATALSALSASAKASAAGLGETKVIADAATSAMNAYGAANLSAEQSVSVMIEAVRLGKMEASALAGSLGKVIPVASSLGVGFGEVGAAIASMTRLGMDANIATTSLRAILMAIYAPGEQAKEALKGVGLNADDLRASLRERGLLATLQTLREKFADNAEAEAAVFGSTRALTGVLAMLGSNAKATEEIFATMGKTTPEALEKAFGVKTQSSMFALQQMTQALSRGMIQIGEQVLPVIAPFFVAWGNILNRVAGAFAALSPWMKKAVVGILGFTAGIGPAILVGGMFVSMLGNIGKAYLWATGASAANTVAVHANVAAIAAQTAAQAVNVTQTAARSVALATNSIGTVANTAAMRTSVAVMAAEQMARQTTTAVMALQTGALGVQSGAVITNTALQMTGAGAQKVLAGATSMTTTMLGLNTAALQVNAGAQVASNAAAATGVGVLGKLGGVIGGMAPQITALGGGSAALGAALSLVLVPAAAAAGWHLGRWWSNMIGLTAATSQMADAQTAIVQGFDPTFWDMAAGKVGAFWDRLRGKGDDSTPEQRWAVHVDAVKRMRDGLKLAGKEWEITNEYTAENIRKVEEINSRLQKMSGEKVKIRVADEAAKAALEAQRRQMEEITAEIEKQMNAAQKASEEAAKSHGLLTSDQVVAKLQEMGKLYDEMVQKGVHQNQLTSELGGEFEDLLKKAQDYNLELPAGTEALTEAMRGTGGEIEKMLGTMEQQFHYHMFNMGNKAVELITDATGRAATGFGNAIIVGAQNGYKEAQLGYEGWKRYVESSPVRLNIDGSALTAQLNQAITDALSNVGDGMGA